MEIKRAGFFRELSHGGPDGPSLIEARRPHAETDEQRIISYLRKGSLLVAAGVGLDDYFDAAKKGVESLAVYTDGDWIWPADLAYYVSQYHVAPPADFVAHMREQKWRPPAVSRERLAEVLASLDRP